MNKREAERQLHLETVLLSLGFTRDEAAKLRRISMTLHRWHELECGMGDNDRREWCIERDDEDTPFMVTHVQTRDGVKTYRHRVPDRETGARRRLAAILDNCNKARRTAAWEPLGFYVQTDPRGAALYILRPGDIPEGMRADSCYTRGICVY